MSECLDIFYIKFKNVCANLDFNPSYCPPKKVTENSFPKVLVCHQSNLPLFVCLTYLCRDLLFIIKYAFIAFRNIPAHWEYSGDCFYVWPFSFPVITGLQTERNRAYHYYILTTMCAVEIVLGLTIFQRISNYANKNALLAWHVRPTIRLSALGCWFGGMIGSLGHRSFNLIPKPSSLLGY